MEGLLSTGPTPSSLYSNMPLSIKEIMDDEDFTDIILVGEGNLKMKAHKVILASSSRFFKEFLMENSHPHLLLYMRGITARHLHAMVHLCLDHLSEDILKLSITTRYRDIHS